MWSEPHVGVDLVERLDVEQRRGQTVELIAVDGQQVLHFTMGGLGQAADAGAACRPRSSRGIGLRGTGLWAAISDVLLGRVIQQPPDLLAENEEHDSDHQRDRAEDQRRVGSGAGET